jgi:hypothetical protein
VNLANLRYYVITDLDSFIVTKPSESCEAAVENVSCVTFVFFANLM